MILIRLITVWLIMVGPPAAPRLKTAALSFTTIVGDMLDNGRLPAATAFASAPTSPKELATPGSIEKSSIWLFMNTPVPGIITLEPNEVLIVAVQATQKPL